MKAGGQRRSLGCRGTQLTTVRIILVTNDEKTLLETTARSLLKLQQDISDRVEGMDIVLRELACSRELALPRLKLKADLLRMKGTPSKYLESFIQNLETHSRSDTS